MEDILSPEEIEQATFPDSQFGYDKARVDAYMRTLAAEVRHLQRRLEIAEEKATKPYLAAGKEIGDLLQAAQDVADELKRDTDLQAATALQEAKRAEQKGQDEAAAALRNAKRESDDLLRAAHDERERIRSKGAEMLRTAEAQASVIKIEAQRGAKDVRDAAKAQAAEIKAKAEAVVHEKTGGIEKRVRQLQEAEVVLKRRIKALAERLQLLQSRSAELEEEPEEKLTFVDPGPDEDEGSLSIQGSRLS